MPNSPPSRTVQCPHCGALPGKNCLRNDGTELKRRVHWQRVAAYWEEAKRRQENLPPPPVPPRKDLVGQ